MMRHYKAFSKELTSIVRDYKCHIIFATTFVRHFQFDPLNDFFSEKCYYVTKMKHIEMILHTLIDQLNDL